jgi:DNA processing protein
VPGEITSSLAAGTNALLRLGATPLTSTADVLEAYGMEAAAEEPLELGADAGRLLDRLRETPAGADALARATGLSASAVAAALAELELAGLVSESAGVYRGVVPAV